MDVWDFQKRINQYMKTRTPLDVKAVYETLKDSFPLTLTHTFALENGEEDYGEDYIEVKLDDKEEDARFDEALTVKVTVPESWSSAKLTTGGKTANLEIYVDEDGSHFVYANIVPSANISTIRP